MAAAGTIFLSENSSQGRRWTMGMRLPDTKPLELLKKNWEALVVGPSALTYEQLGLHFALGRVAPPGVLERVMAGCYGFGTFLKSWKRGSLIELSLPNGAYLLLEMRSESEAAREAVSPNAKLRRQSQESAASAPVEDRPASPDSEKSGSRPGSPDPEGGSPKRLSNRMSRESIRTDSPATIPPDSPEAKATAAAPPPPVDVGKKDGQRVYFLALEIRARKTERPMCWAMLQRLREVAQVVPDDFPGLVVEEEMCCPGCLASDQFRKKPTRWPASQVTSKPVKCELCGESVELSHVPKSKAPPPTPLTIDFMPLPESAGDAELMAPAASMVAPTGDSMKAKKGTVQRPLPVAPPEKRFISNQMRLGKVIEANRKLYMLLDCEASRSSTSSRMAASRQSPTRSLRQIVTRRTTAAGRTSIGCAI